MITAYVKEALQNAQYERLEDGSIYGDVPQLPGVLANAATVEACRDQLAEVIEEWILVRVSQRLAIPRLGRCRVQVRKAA